MPAAGAAVKMLGGGSGSRGAGPEELCCEVRFNACLTHLIVPSMPVDTIFRLSWIDDSARDCEESLHMSVFMRIRQGLMYRRDHDVSDTAIHTFAAHRARKSA